MEKSPPAILLLPGTCRHWKRYRQHFRTPDIRRHDLQHEELLKRHPEAWEAEVRHCTGIGTLIR